LEKQAGMGPSYDCAASVLLCAEDNAAILGLDDDEECSWAAAVTPPRHAAAAGGGGADGFWMDYHVQSDGCIAELVEREAEHMPMEGYPQMLLRRLGGLDLAAVRRDAIDWIWKVSCPPLAPIGILVSILDSDVLRCDGLDSSKGAAFIHFPADFPSDCCSLISSGSVLSW
jgi:hypothetical protein